MKRLPIATQLTIGFGSLIAFLAAVVAFGIYEQGRLADIAERQYKHPFTVTNAVARAEADLARIMRDVEEVALATSPQEIDQAMKHLHELEKKVLADLKLAQERYLGPRAEVEALITAVTQWQPLLERLAELKRAGQHEDAKALIQGDISKRLEAIDAQAMKIYQAAFKRAEVMQQEAQAERDMAATVSVVVGMLAVLTSLSLAVALTRIQTRPLQQAVEVARAVASGDLTRQITAEGQNEAAKLLRALQEMQSSLARVVGAVRQGAEVVASASEQIAQGNQDLAQRTQETAAALEETAASAEELGSTVGHNADNARAANQLARQASEVATQGGQVVGQVVDTMRGINESSRRIADIIGVIDGIAFQTNILALNAAVEAARAGEAGRGFAVVASEVRSLAQRSAGAAREIKALISASVARVEQGSQQVDAAGATMSEVVAAIGRVTDLMGEISAATTEQSTGIGQVGAAVSQMEQTTQQNAALVEESAAAAESLAEQAQALVAEVDMFKLGAGAAHTTALRKTTLKSASGHGAAPATARAPAPRAVAAPPAKAHLASPGRPFIAAPASLGGAAGRPALAAAPSKPQASDDSGDWTTF
jgi:methyl-accepting chemotaxis protein-1 (serine sensor receptor)